MNDWQVPCCVLNISEAERKLLTIRINRAKGTHVAFKMADIMKDLVHNHELDKSYIAQSIGANLAEIDLLLMEGVFSKMDISKHEYSKAWIPKK
jgi:hypothetical protein